MARDTSMLTPVVLSQIQDGKTHEEIAAEWNSENPGKPPITGDTVRQYVAKITRPGHVL